jgi:hypothetical protein
MSSPNRRSLTCRGSACPAVRGSPDPAPELTAGLPQAKETCGQGLRRGQETCAERRRGKETCAGRRENCAERVGRVPGTAPRQSRVLFLGVLYACVLSSAALAADSTPVGLHFERTSDVTRIQVVATLPANLLTEIPEGKLAAARGEQLLVLMVDDAARKDGVAVLGNYERRNAQLVLTPRYALAYGQHYRATLTLPGEQSTSAEYRVPDRPKTPPAIVENIYPSADVLPANLLKFYIRFSKPMRETSEIFDRITLLDAQGKPILDPWRRTELWSADCKRLTLFIHPGRIKQGVNLREQFGPVLEPEETYTLRIDPQLLDGDGQPLGKPFTKKFRTTTAERSRPLPYKWTVHPPSVSSREPLKLEFPRPLDRALLDRLLTVTDADGKIVTGRIEVGSEEKLWLFHPARNWSEGDYLIEVDENLEDLAGNTPLRLFDVDLEEPSPAPPRLTIRFRPK